VWQGSYDCTKWTGGPILRKRPLRRAARYQVQSL